MCPFSNQTVAFLSHFYLAAENLILLLLDILVISDLSQVFGA